MGKTEYLDIQGATTGDIAGVPDGEWFVLCYLLRGTEESSRAWSKHLAPYEAMVRYIKNGMLLWL